MPAYDEAVNARNKPAETRFGHQVLTGAMKIHN